MLISERYTSSEITKRIRSHATNQWNQIDDLMAFDHSHGIPSTFFVGVNNGCYLVYKKDVAMASIKRIEAQGFDVGVHGIAYNNVSAMMQEHQIFQKISGINAFGIWMHYLRTNADTIRFLSDVGYIFDSTDMAMKNPYKVGGMWEFPLHVMDGHVLHKNGAHWQNSNLEEAQQFTKEKIITASKMGIRYFTLLFHDRYFSDEFKTWKDWYLWFVEYCKVSGIQFISYRDAIIELEHKNKGATHR